MMCLFKIYFNQYDVRCSLKCNQKSLVANASSTNSIKGSVTHGKGYELDKKAWNWIYKLLRIDRNGTAEKMPQAVAVNMFKYDGMEWKSRFNLLPWIEFIHH